MFDPSIQDILAKRLQALPELVMEANLRRDIDELIARHLPSGQLAVIDDTDTAIAYGDLVFKALKNRYEAMHITLARGVEADDTALTEIEMKSGRADMPIAVGSGTINDLVKYAAHKAKKPYLLFPTAASMNGYVSANSSIPMHGHKQSLPATLPRAVFMELQLIAAAPTRLSQAGLGDSLARPTAQADWLLSHHLLGTTYDDDCYKLTAPYEMAVFSQAEAIRRGDNEAISALLKLLLLSGFAMTIAGSSIPASGAEHMLAHAYGMGKTPPTRANLHGEEIAFTTLQAAAIQEKLLATSKPTIHASIWDTAMEQYFGETECAFFQPLYEKKRAGIAKQFPDGSIPSTRMDAAREAIGAISIPRDMLTLTCKQAGLPIYAETLGWNARYFAEITPLARYTRDRFTCLDLR